MKKKIILLVIIGLILIPPIVALAADITIHSNCFVYNWNSFTNSGIFWISTDTGYTFFIPEDVDKLAYKKTTDGGSTWGSTTQVDSTQDYMGVSIFADWNIPGNSGTKIHLAYIEYDDPPQVHYQYLDTFDDSLSGEINIETLSALDEVTFTLSYHHVSIVKSVGTTLAVAYRNMIDDPDPDDHGFEISIDGGNTWITKTSPYEGTTDVTDYLLLYPANLADPDDLWATYWDRSENEISLKTYDSTEDSWSETSIATNMTDSSTYIQWGGDIRHSDGHLIFASWNGTDIAGAALRIWDINGESDITELTPVTTGAGKIQASVMIDQTTNRIYVSYLKGTIGVTTSSYYQYSNDGGVTWSGEISYGESTGNFGQIHTAGMKASYGGKFQPVWYEIGGSYSDVTTGTVNSIEISSYEYESDPAIAPEYIIDCPTCTDNLTSSGNFTSNETFTGGPPGFAVIDDAASESGAAPIWLWGWVGMFSIIVPGFFVTYMERKHGAGNGNLLLRMGIALIVMGLLVTWGRFDWWMIVLYLFIAAAPAFMSRQYDIGGAGGISQHGWIGFCATSWIGLTIINRILEGQFLTSSESTWWCSIQLFNEFRVFDLFTVPVLNFQFFTVGIPSLLRWDYSFFGGNAELIQYFLYTITAVVAFILFVILVGLLFNAFRAR